MENKSTKKTLSDIAVVVESGAKYKTEQGFSAVKDGVNKKFRQEGVHEERKPKWLRVNLGQSAEYKKVKSLVPFDVFGETNDRRKCKIIQVSLHNDILVN